MRMPAESMHIQYCKTMDTSILKSINSGLNILDDSRLNIYNQTAGSERVNGVAYWDGSKWNKLGLDSTNGVRRTIFVENDTLILPGFVYALFAGTPELTMWNLIKAVYLREFTYAV